MVLWLVGRGVVRGCEGLDEFVGAVQGDLVQREEPFRGSFHVWFGHAAVGAQDVSDAVVDAAFQW